MAATSHTPSESSEDREKKQQESRRRIFAPRGVLDDPKIQPDSTGQDQPNRDDADPALKLGRDDVHAKAFEVLGLLEELARTKSDKGKKQTSDDLAMSVIKDPDAYLAQLEKDTGTQGSDVSSDGSYEDVLKKEIKKLLTFPEVSKLLKTEIGKELARYARVEDKLKRLRTLRYATKKATLDMHATYLRSKRENKGALIESAGKRIEALHRVATLAQVERDGIVAQASMIEQGFMNTQELIRYKRQMREKGIAITPSREKLLQRLVEHAMAGHRVFLVGSTGTGKTELAFYAANELTGDFEIIPWHEGTVMKDVLGQMQITRTDDGTVQSKFKPGPVTRAMQKGTTAIHEEVTSGSTRTMMGLKPFWNIRPGQYAKIPEMNGEAFCIDESFIELFTGNPKSEQTKEREDMDPAILRMLKGIHVEYMPADESAKIVIAQLMEESGLAKLAKSEIDLIRRLGEAAELMQQCHENILTPEQQNELKTACGIDDLRLQKNFLDPGTFFGLFSRWDYERRKGKTFREYLAEQLQEFVNDPKSLGIPEEKKILLAILRVKKCVDRTSTEDHITITQPEKYEKPYTLPSEMAILDGKKAQHDDDPFADPDPPNPDTPPDINTPDDIVAKIQSDIINLLGGNQGNPNQNNPDTTPPVAPIDPFNDFNALTPRAWIDDQYTKRFETYDYFGFNQFDSIDNSISRPPTPAEIQVAMTPDKIAFIRTLEKPLLIITPIGVRMRDLVMAFNSKSGAMPVHNATINHWNDTYAESVVFYHDFADDMVYRVSQFDPNNHGGKTKQQLVAEGNAWQVLVVEGADNVSRKDMDPKEMLAGDMRAGLVGLTPEDDIMLQAEGLRMGKPFGGRRIVKILTGAYDKSLNMVPTSEYDSIEERLKFGGDRPNINNPFNSSRYAIRLI